MPDLLPLFDGDSRRILLLDEPSQDQVEILRWTILVPDLSDFVANVSRVVVLIICSIESIINLLKPCVESMFTLFNLFSFRIWRVLRRFLPQLANRLKYTRTTVHLGCLRLHLILILVDDVQLRGSLALRSRMLHLRFLALSWLFLLGLNSFVTIECVGPIWSILVGRLLRFACGPHLRWQNADLLLW